MVNIELYLYYSEKKKKISSAMLLPLGDGLSRTMEN